MRPKTSNSTPQGDLFRGRLENILNHNHELYRLADLIPWQAFDEEFGVLYAEKRGRPGIPIRLLVGLTYLGHAFALSDEEVVYCAGWKTPTGNISAERVTCSISCPLIHLL